MPSGPIRLHLADVLTAVPSQVGVDAGLVMLTEDDEPYRSLRIIIGQAEARAIFSAWHGDVPGRPSTWDVYVSTVGLLGGRIDRMVITAVHEERHFFAHLELEQGGERHVLACRPSDGIAIALRAYNTEILAEPAVLDAAGVLPDGTKPVAKPTDPDSALVDREAALSAREAELAERERRLREREHQMPLSPWAGAEEPQPPAAAAAGSLEADEPPAPGAAGSLEADEPPPPVGDAASPVEHPPVGDAPSRVEPGSTIPDG